MTNRYFSRVRKALIFVSLFSLTACYDSGSSGSAANGTSSGVGGSTARFTIQNNHLITIEERSIIVYSLESPSNPVEVFRTGARWTLETIFPYQENLLFIGSQQGAIILELSETGELNEISNISHTRSCDPVVVNDTQMFVTIRSGSGCWESTISNRLLVYDISDLNNPIQTANIVIDHPSGLGLQDSTLFVCYAGGLKEFDVSSSTPELLNDFQNMSCNDLIPNGDNLVLTGDSTISQVVADSGVLTVLSEIHKGD